MADATEIWRLEVEDVAEAKLKAVATADSLPDNGFAAMASPKQGANGHGFDHNEDVSDILDFDNIGANVFGTTNGGESSASRVETGESSKHVGEVVEEEIVELEFEKIKPKLATHSMHCPNCKKEITKVTLRRKVVSYQPNYTEKPVEPVVPAEPKHEPDATHQEPLVGCLSCLSLFTCSDDGCFNPFDIFTKRRETTISPASPPPTGQGQEKENTESCLSMFWVVRERKDNPKPDDHPELSKPAANKLTSAQVPSHPFVEGTSSVPKGEVFDPEAPSLILPQSPKATENDDTRVNIENEPETVVVAQSGGRSWLGYEGILAEILKSIVYGGLMEVIASLSVVASAASSDASTLSIISLAIASLIGGVFIIGHNLWDLRDDCYKDSSNNEAANKYKELLGQVDYFPLHVFFAILSFLVFGMVPPVAYGFSFHEKNDKDYTIMVVAIASLLCVALLAIFKAYINKCTVLEYFKTVVYHITAAVSVSGVSYVAGNLLTRLMEEYGLFDMSSGGGMSLLPYATTPSLVSI
ncbi:hypothetical protein E3N88_21987 [Mikania micrantha]|uniref:Membrane protein of ER body-like protein n=1 Tax=Mikania micrantha TaxID=192012 RepID=A0A5N6N945_9ASTR|nr:hypothetical protein E3N88_21987 [Mikania micrantha]